MNTNEPRRDKEVAIYRAALDLLARGANPAQVKVQQIAEAAGIGKGTVYEYFPSKEAVFRGLFPYCLEEEVRRLAGPLESCCTLEGLIDGCLTYLEDLAQNRAAAYRLLVDTMIGDWRAMLPDTETQLSGLKELLTATIRRLQAAGEIDASLRPEFCIMVLTDTAMSCLRPTSCGSPDAGPDAGQLERVLADCRILLHRAMMPL